MITLTTPDGSTATLHLHGAHVTSWKTASGNEQLFLSTKSEFGDGAAIRGGVPVIFPQFSLLGPLPRHGFVRNSAWEMVHQVSDQATLRFSDTEATRAIWPHAFTAELTVRVSDDRLEMTLRIVNNGDTAFAFSIALHTYLRVQDIAQTTVEGLQGLTFRDANTMVEHTEEPSRISFGQEVDRLYYEAGQRAITLHDGPRPLLVTTTGFPDAVVWNPGQTKSDKLPDMEHGGWQRFVCIEAAAAHLPVTLAPQSTWTGQQVLTVLP